jgi:hypothetical protein
LVEHLSDAVARGKSISRGGPVLSSITMDEIRGAWRTLRMPGLNPMYIDYEHGQWWVWGYPDDGDDTLLHYSVVDAEGPGSAFGIAFEEV